MTRIFNVPQVGQLLREISTNENSQCAKICNLGEKEQTGQHPRPRKISYLGAQRLDMELLHSRAEASKRFGGGVSGFPGVRPE